MGIEGLRLDMKRPEYAYRQRASSSTGGTFAVLAVLLAVLLAVSYPVQFAIILLGGGVLAVSIRWLWRRSRSSGVKIPGSTARLCIEQSRELSPDTHDQRWKLTICLVDSQ